jgi:hypothetical protein
VVCATGFVLNAAGGFQRPNLKGIVDFVVRFVGYQYRHLKCRYRLANIDCTIHKVAVFVYLIIKIITKPVRDQFFRPGGSMFIGAVGWIQRPAMPAGCIKRWFKKLFFRWGWKPAAILEFFVLLQNILVLGSPWLLSARHRSDRRRYLLLLRSDYSARLRKKIMPEGS